MDDHDNPFTLTIGSNVTFAGEGTISGRDDVDHAFIVVEGSLSTTIPISESQLDAGASTVHLDNDDHHGGTILRAGDLVFLNNYPTDPGGADLCTPPSQPNATQCSYPNEGPNSLHSFRRREVLRVLSSDSTSVTFANGIQNSYPNVLSNAASTYALWRGIQSYVFITPIQPVANVTIRDIELRRLYLGTKYISNLSIESARAYQTTLALGTCIECKVNFREFDAGGEDNEVNFYEGSQSVKVSGYYHGATCPSDCGIIKFVQGNSAEIIGTFGGLVASATNHGIQHAVMIDTDYLEDLTGFSNGPTSNIHIEATYQPSNDNGQPDVFLSGEPWLAANLTDASIKVSDVALRLSGSNSITVQGLGTGGLSISRSQNVAITGGTYTDVKLDGDGPDGIIPSNNVSLSGLTLKHIPTNNPSDPTWVEVYDTNLLSLTDVTVDITGAPVQATQTFFPLIQFKDVDGLIIQNLRVRCIANQTGLLFWDAGNISNFNAIGGSYTLPVPFPGVVPNGQTGSTSCPTP
jgi:hypothetical protein